MFRQMIETMGSTYLRVSVAYTACTSVRYISPHTRTNDNIVQIIVLYYCRLSLQVSIGNVLIVANACVGRRRRRLRTMLSLFLYIIVLRG